MKYLKVIYGKKRANFEYKIGEGYKKLYESEIKKEEN